MKTTSSEQAQCTQWTTKTTNDLLAQSEPGRPRTTGARCPLCVSADRTSATRRLVSNRIFRPRAAPPTARETSLCVPYFDSICIGLYRDTLQRKTIAADMIETIHHFVRRLAHSTEQQSNRTTVRRSITVTAVSFGRLRFSSSRRQRKAKTAADKTSQ